MPSPISQADIKDIQNVSIIGSMTNIILLIWFHFSNRCTKILYGQNGANTLVVVRKKPVIEVRGNFLSMMCQDLKNILEDRASPLQSLSIKLKETNHGFRNRFFNALKQAMTSKLNVTSVRIKGASGSNFLSVLRNLEALSLNTIKLTSRHSKKFKAVMKLEEGAETKELKMTACEKIFNEVTSLFKKSKGNDIQEKKVETLDTLHGTLEISTINTNFERKLLFKQEVEELAEEPPIYKALAQPVILLKILSHLDGTEIAKFRKVSSMICRNLDCIRPNPKITSFSINLRNSQKIKLIINSRTIVYRQCQNGCFVNQHFVDGDFRSILINDLEIMLRNQRDTIGTVCLNFATEPELFERLQSKILLGPIEKRKNPLKIRKLEVSVYNPENILSILHHIDSEALKILHIKANPIGNVQREIDLKEVVALDQWLSAEQLVMDSFVIENQVRDLNLESKTHLEIVVKSLSMEDLVYLKERFLTSPHHLHFQISYKSLEDNNQNEWNLDEDDLYFQIVPNNQVLCVTRNEHAFTFSRIEASDVPMGADIS
ncbi:unnamed protein product [Caenorhabditis brenneri]